MLGYNLNTLHQDLQTLTSYYHPKSLNVHFSSRSPENVSSSLQLNWYGAESQSNAHSVQRAERRDRWEVIARPWPPRLQASAKSPNYDSELANKQGVGV